MHSGEIIIKRFITGVLFTFFLEQDTKGIRGMLRLVPTSFFLLPPKISSSQQCEKLSENYPQMKFLLCRYVERQVFNFERQVFNFESHVFNFERQVWKFERKIQVPFPNCKFHFERQVF